MAKRAKLGFKVIGLPGELMVSDERDFEQTIADKKLDSERGRRASKLRCYHKHKELYNKQKRMVKGSV